MLMNASGEQRYRHSCSNKRCGELQEWNREKGQWRGIISYEMSVV